jgi:integrase
VDDAVVQRFLTWLETRTLHARPRDLVRQVPALWAEAISRVSGWPAVELSSISFRPASPNLRWDELPDGLRTDAEAYLTARANPDVFDNDEDAPSQPLAESTIRLQRDHIRLAVSILARSGAAVHELDGLRALVAVDAVKTVLRHYHQAAGGKPSAFAIGIARTLIQIACYHVKVREDHLAGLKRLARQLPAIPFDLTAKNKALLAELEIDQLRARLICLPETLAREASSTLATGGRLKFVDAQVAVAVETLLVAPVRAKNLIALNWAQNFREPQGPKGKLVLYVPKDCTKTKRRDLTFEFPPELAETIRWYRREILPRLGGDPNGDLFVSQGGRRKGQDTLSDQIILTIEKKVGIHMTPHQFRHFAAALYLEEHPEDYQTVSDLLGHAFAKTTLVYAGSCSRRASVSYVKLIIEQRAAGALKFRRPRRSSK